MTEHVKNRNKLKAVYDARRFDDLLNMSTLSKEDKEIFRMHYLENKGFGYIGDTLGYAESTIKRKHKAALNKLSHFL